MFNVQGRGGAAGERRSPSGRAPGLEHLTLNIQHSYFRRLLVRVLQAGASPAEQAACRNGARLEIYKSIEGRAEVSAKRLVLPLKAAAGTYKVLLFAHRQGEALPVTTGGAGRTKLTVQWPDLKDEYTFTPNPDGRTRVAMSRDGHAVVEVK